MRALDAAWTLLGAIALGLLLAATFATVRGATVTPDPGNAHHTRFFVRSATLHEFDALRDRVFGELGYQMCDDQGALDRGTPCVVAIEYTADGVYATWWGPDL